MRYSVTLEQTRRFVISFDADSDDAAEAKAAQINEEATSVDFEDGDEERDYALFNRDTNQLILDWD